MGWFWADNQRANAPVAPHPVPNPGAIPPGCPMHKSDSQPTPFPPRQDPNSETPSSCPVKSSSHPLRYPTSPSESQATEPISSRPSRTQSALSKLNPLNYIPSNLSNAPSQSQEYSLPLSRETSSIPRADADSNWEYPSPQQMYNAMLRKGYTDTDITAVEPMVAVHNFLNEGAWNEILEWERLFAPGLSHGWASCRRGEQYIAQDRARREFLKQRREQLGMPTQSSETNDQEPQPKLLRFMGRPNEPTPKARILTMLGNIFPESFGSEPPFDRHDWYVSRRMPDGNMKQVRYVIDYYSGGTQETGEPVFYLDIRPALDTPTAAAERAMRWGGDLWYRASGGAARESAIMEKLREQRS